MTHNSQIWFEVGVDVIFNHSCGVSWQQGWHIFSPSRQPTSMRSQSDWKILEATIVCSTERIRCCKFPLLAHRMPKQVIPQDQKQWLGDVWTKNMKKYIFKNNDKHNRENISNFYSPAPMDAPANPSDLAWVMVVEVVAPVVAQWLFLESAQAAGLEQEGEPGEPSFQEPLHHNYHHHPHTPLPPFHQHHQPS